ncbi:MAG: hypothetical protein WAO28_02540 [Candidatus Microsaccharimonas sp.]
MQSPETKTSEAPKKLEINSPSPEARTAAIAALASEFHEEWRDARRSEDGTYRPRLKSTTDESWIERHGTDQVDIANTTYADLPVDWQTENKAAAEFLVSELVTYSEFPDLDDPSIRSEIGEEIHEAWLDRNEWAEGTELDVPFEQLHKDEQEKDIDQAEIAEEIFSR